MIVRIATEGQYKVSSALLDRLNEFDNKLVQIVANGDESTFRQALNEILAMVRAQGTPVATEEFVSSDIIVPAPDTTLEEARTLFVGDGIIPG